MSEQWGPAVRRIWIARDLVVALAGLFVIGLGFAGGGWTAFLVGTVFVVTGLGALAYQHRPVLTRWWGWKVTLALCALGVIFMLYPLSIALQSTPADGSHATGTAQWCVWVPATNRRDSAPDHYSCTIAVTWPNGTSGSYPMDIPSGGNGTRVTLYQTRLGPTTDAPSWPRALAFFVYAGLLGGQAALSLLVLLAHALRRA